MTSNEHLPESGIPGRAVRQRTPILWVHSFADIYQRHYCKKQVSLEEGDGVEPLTFSHYPGFQTLFAPVRGTFLTLPFFTGGPVLLGRSFRVHPVMLGAGRESRTPLSTAWKAEDAPCVYLHGRCGEIRTLNLPVKSGLL